MPRKVFHGRRGGRPRNAMAGHLDVKRVARELAAVKAAEDADQGQDDDVAPSLKSGTRSR